MTAAGPRALGLRTVIYHVPDLARAREWYAAAFGVAPYFDEPFYVGFQVGGFELGLDPDCSRVSPGEGGSAAYWGVANMADAHAAFVAAGAAVLEPPREVGGGIMVAMLADPFGNAIGLIENPHFDASAVA
jgi:predicted enzyme related to lactoylglutathione lyase